jgi:hypothetical protein
VDEETAVANARATLGRWYAELCDTSAFILVACDLLAAVFDGDALRTLAGASLRHPDDEPRRVLPDALREVGITLHPADSAPAQEAALTAMAAQALRGALTPRGLTTWVHQRFAHEFEPARELAELDDVYDDPAVFGLTAGEVEARIMTEAQRIVDQ